MVLAQAHKDVKHAGDVCTVDTLQAAAEKILQSGRKFKLTTEDLVEMTMTIWRLADDMVSLVCAIENRMIQELGAIPLRRSISVSAQAKDLQSNLLLPPLEMAGADPADFLLTSAAAAVAVSAAA